MESDFDCLPASSSLLRVEQKSEGGGRVESRKEKGGRAGQGREGDGEGE